MRVRGAAVAKRYLRLSGRLVDPPLALRIAPLPLLQLLGLARGVARERLGRSALGLNHALHLALAHLLDLEGADPIELEGRRALEAGEHQRRAVGDGHTPAWRVQLCLQPLLLADLLLALALDQLDVARALGLRVLELLLGDRPVGRARRLVLEKIGKDRRLQRLRVDAEPHARLIRARRERHDRLIELAQRRDRHVLAQPNHLHGRPMTCWACWACWSPMGR